MTAETFEEAHQKTAQLLGDAVATVARQAIRPELEPFGTRLGEVNKRLDLRLERLQEIEEANQKEIGKVKGVALGLASTAEMLKGGADGLRGALAQIGTSQAEWQETSTRLEARMGESTKTVESLVAAQVDRWTTEQQALFEALKGLGADMTRLAKEQGQQHEAYEARLAGLKSSQQGLELLLAQQQSQFDAGVNRFLQAQQDEVDAWKSKIQNFESQQQARLNALRGELDQLAKAQRDLGLGLTSLNSRLEKEGVDRTAAAKRQTALQSLFESNSQRLDQLTTVLVEVRAGLESSSEELVTRIEGAEGHLAEQARQLAAVRGEMKGTIEKELAGWSDAQRQTVAQFRDELRGQLDQQRAVLETISAFDKRFADEARQRTQLMTSQELALKDLQQVQLRLVRANRVGIALFVLTLLAAVLAGAASLHTFLH